MTDMLKYERELWNHGFHHVAGTDEAGRGPLAGPVVVAAVIFERDFLIDGVTDSKALDEEDRERYFELIQKNALAYHIAIVGHEDIDRINILQASLRGMRECVEKLTVKADYVLVDGHMEPFPRTHEYSPRQQAVVKGDAHSFTIAAASILAKVTRDRLMTEYDKIFPKYHFAKNKGYPTPEHVEALKSHGLSIVHRKTFCAGIMTEQLGLGL